MTDKELQRKRALARVRARMRLEQEQQAPQLTGMEQAAAFAGKFAEGAFGIGDELGAIGRGIGGSVYDILNTDKDIMQALRENFNWSQDIEAARSQMKQFEEESPLLSDVATGAGFVSGLAVPVGVVGKGASVAKAAGVGAGYGAGFGALSGEGEEGRIEGALMGAAGGALLGGVGQAAVRQFFPEKLPTYTVKKGNTTLQVTANSQEEALEKVRAATAQMGGEEPKIVDSTVVSDIAEGVETAVKTATERGDFSDLKSSLTRVHDIAVGVSDAIRRRISPEVGGRLQRADETAMRKNTLETAEFVENADMQRVIKLADDDEKFKSMVLDFAQGAEEQGTLMKYIAENLDGDAALAFGRYMQWSAKANNTYNEKLGRYVGGAPESQIDMFPKFKRNDNYLHTQKTAGLPKGRQLAGKQSATGRVDFLDDDLNLPMDVAEKELQRGVIKEGAKVNVKEYANPFLTNASRITNNNRLLQIQEKFGIKNINTGADGLMDALETSLKKRGLGDTSAREARNAIATLIKGQNRSANPLIKSIQNAGYSVLSGPKTALLNLHDIPMALWNNGIRSAAGLINSSIKASADVRRLGIDNQNVGEFVQGARRASSQMSKAERAEQITKKVSDFSMKLGFQQLDRFAKNQVLKTVAQDAVNRVNSGTLRERWGTYFDPADLARLEGAIKRTGGDVSKMDNKAAELYDELITLGLGQQQLISAAGRPLEWLNNPNLRPLWMMRGFAIKQNALLSEKIVKALKEGDKAEAAKQAAMYLVLPGASYAGMNVGRNVLFKEDYEPSGEEFMWSLLDSVLGPVTLNSISTGSSYERSLFARKDIDGLVANALLPPLGLYGDIGDSILGAIVDGDLERLGDFVVDHPIAKQWMALYEKAK